MADINLIPKQPEENKQIAQSVKFLKTGSIVTLTLFAILGGAILSISYYFSNQLQEESKLRDQLKTEVENLENVETAMLLMKDRAKKAQTVLGGRKVENKYLVFRGIAGELVDGAQIEEINLSDAGIAFEVSTASSQQIASVITSAISLVEEGQSLTMVEFDYNPFTGYTSNLKLE